MDGESAKNGRKIVVSKNGPYLVSGNIPLDKQIIEIGEGQDQEKWVKGKKYPLQQGYALCRCGQSRKKPFCDGTHEKVNFDGTEKASRAQYVDQAEGEIEGPGLILTDAPTFCAAARFCHREGGVWDLTERSDQPELKKIAIEECCHCPSGKLVVWDKKTRQPIEPAFEPSISLVEDPQADCSGPIWVKGGVPVESADGTPYEARNRQTLCRCGHSDNKPFCDGSHIAVKFSDGDESLTKQDTP